MADSMKKRKALYGELKDRVERLESVNRVLRKKIKSTDAAFIGEVSSILWQFEGGSIGLPHEAMQAIRESWDRHFGGSAAAEPIKLTGRIVSKEKRPDMVIAGDEF